MVEQFENNYSTLLNGAIDDDDTNITVDAAPVNMTGEFRIKIDDEIILVGAVSGLTFTGCTRGVEDTTAASHSDNAVVRHVLTAEALLNAVSTGELNLVKSYQQSGTNSTTHNVTVTAAPITSKFIIAISSYNRDVNTPTCTNVTFTEILGTNFSTGAYLSVYLGTISGGDSGTTISITATGSNWIITDTYEIKNAVNGTIVDTSTLTNTSASAVAGAAIGEVEGLPGNLFVIAAAQNDGTTGFNNIYPSQFGYQSYHGANAALSSAIGILIGTRMNGYFTGGTNGADLAAGIVLIS